MPRRQHWSLQVTLGMHAVLGNPEAGYCLIAGLADAAPCHARASKEICLTGRSACILQGQSWQGLGVRALLPPFSRTAVALAHL